MKTQYHEIINSFVDKYGLNRGEVMAEIEKTFFSILSKWHGQDIVVLFSDDRLVASGYSTPLGMVKQTPIDLTTMRSWTSIKKVLDKNTGTAACLKEVAAYKPESRIKRTL